MQDQPVLKRFNVETPLGVVHLVSFKKTGVNHRQVIVDVLSEVSGKALSLGDIVQSEEHPRPTIPAIDFDVNWTHSGDVCVLAYGDENLRIGVDYEIHKSNRLKIADRFFSAQEAAALKDMGQERAFAEFFRLWCRKEALFKCVGGDFFEGTMRRSVLDSPVCLESGRQVYFCDVACDCMAGDLDCEGRPASLCVAVCH